MVSHPFLIALEVENPKKLCRKCERTGEKKKTSFKPIKRAMSITNDLISLFG